MDNNRNPQYPYGRDVTTLVVCINELHRKYVTEAFELKAKYIIWGDATMGSRYDKVIAFRPPMYMTSSYDDYIETSLKTTLGPDGKFFLV